MLIYQIEVSNICSLRCAYCPHPGQQRKKGMMDMETFAKCVEFHRRHAKTRPLYLHNFGEPALHPRLAEFIRYAASQSVECSFFTNGMRNRHTPFAASYWRTLAQAGLRRVDFSAHALSEEEFRAIAQPHVRVENVFTPTPESLGSWAGQVGPPSEPIPQPCFFARHDAFVVLWNGDLSPCCLAVEGAGPWGTIDDLLQGKPYCFTPFHLCGACDSLREEEET